jgi:pimeloyl-ACP methyl ester carboxylesterase
MEPRYRYAYLHGFASSSVSRKGVYLRQVFRNRGIELELPDLNVPSFETMTYSAILEALDTLDGLRGGSGFAWRLIGSSMGGYLTARWAELRTDRVDRAVLFCPGFDMAARWPELLGEEAVRRWQAEGRMELPDAQGVPRPVHWELIEDARLHPPFPEPACPLLILHGVRDEVVPVAVSREYARDRAHARLVELDDDHSLGSSLQQIAQESLTFLLP